MSHTFSIPVEPPYPWESILRYLTYRSTPRLETIAADRYTRQTPAGVVTVEFDSPAQALRCSPESPAEGVRESSDLRARIQRLFDAGHDPSPVDRALGRSPLLRARVRKLPGLRAPGCWEPFELCLRVILGQQVSVKAAHTLMGRLAALCPSLLPAQLAATDIGTLGLPARRLQTLRTFAERVSAGDIRLHGQSWDEVAGQLAGVPGFGPWTLEYLAIRLGRDADAFPVQDLGLMRATGTKTPRELEKLAEAWRPYRGYAAMYLWAVE
ncbi:MAG: DNA-3-methyladenine glycosylase 2 family protein [Acidobacteriia bacterium]|nr:DNA-3-methyladenine glycosylase 2 family protein [Terriglobia bacterium]